MSNEKKSQSILIMLKNIYDGFGDYDFMGGG